VRATTFLLALALLVHCRADVHRPISVELRRGYATFVENCEECLLVEIDKESGRYAYFVEPKPSCMLKSNDAAEVSLLGTSLLIALSPEGRSRLRSCFRAEPDFFRVVVSVDGVLVGDALVSPDMEAISIEGGRRFGRLVKLFPVGLGT